MNCLTGAILAYLYYWPKGRVGTLTGTRHGYVRSRPFPHFACFVGDWAIHYNTDADLPWWKQLHYQGNFRTDWAGKNSTKE